MHAFSYRLATALVAILAFVALYVGMYFALVQRGVSIASRTHVVHGSEYLWLGSHGHMLFWPIHRLDRRLRYGYWTEEYSSGGRLTPPIPTVMEMQPTEEMTVE